MAKVEKRFPPANPDGSDTLERHRTAGGEFTPERKALHEQIRAKVRAGVPRSDEPTFFMMGGGPASGKSSILDAGLVELPKAVHIDADAIKAELPEYQEMVAAKDFRAAAFAHEESSELGSQIRDESFAEGQNVLLDGTGNASVDSVRKKVEKARKAGYKVKAQYVSCATDEAVRRSMERAKETGRMVPESFIRHCHASVSRVLPEAVAQGLFDDCQLWDTEHRDDKGRPTLVMSAAGAAVTVHHPELWSKFIQKGTADAS